MPKLFVCVLLSGLLSLQTITTQLIASTGVITGGNLKDYKGKTHTIKPRGKAVVYLFLSPECPLCKNYAPVLQAIQNKYPEVQFYGIVSGKTFTRKLVGEYAKDYKITFPILMDPDKQVAEYLRATVTPEALLIGENGREYYRGLIDDWVTGLGTKRTKASRRYLELAIENLLSGSDLTYATRPIGCLISNY
jgi:thiol-disulfide isomerase/thioredoxin